MRQSSISNYAFFHSNTQNVSTADAPYNICYAGYSKISLLKTQHISGLMNTITGMYTVFCYRREYDSAIDIIYWGQELLTRLNRNDSSDMPDYLNKSEALDMILIANVKLLSGNREEAEELLKKAYETARKFDTVPNYGIGSFKYISDEEVSLHDMIGVTAIESAENMLSQVDNSELTKMWKKIRGM